MMKKQSGREGERRRKKVRSGWRENISSDLRRFEQMKYSGENG